VQPNRQEDAETRLENGDELGTRATPFHACSLMLLAIAGINPLRQRLDQSKESNHQHGAEPQTVVLGPEKSLPSLKLQTITPYESAADAKPKDRYSLVSHRTGMFQNQGDHALARMKVETTLVRRGPRVLQEATETQRFSTIPEGARAPGAG